MLHRNHGFVLIEWMVHFVLLMTIVVITCALFLSWYKVMGRMNRKLYDLLPMHIATDLLRKDLHQALPDNIKGDHEIYLSYDHRYIRWRCTDNKLMRITGTYDVIQQRWLQPVYSVMAAPVERLEYAHTINSLKQQVTLYKDATVPTIDLIVVIRNGLYI